MINLVVDFVSLSLFLSLTHTHTHTHRDSNKAQKMDEKFLYFFLTHIHTDKTTDT